MINKKVVFSLLPFLVVLTLLIVWVNQWSKPKILFIEEYSKQQLLKKIAGVGKNIQIKEITLNKNSNVVISNNIAWLVCHKEQKVGAIFQVKTNQGYSGDIELLIGIDRQNAITGISVFKHNETPGLGDKIESQKSDWLKQFIGKTANNYWQLKSRNDSNNQGYDGITAATITSKAVINLVSKTVSNLPISSLQNC